jgi:hypothetical protein
VFGLSSRHIRDVFVAGEGVVRDRRLARIDRDELRMRSREVAEDLWGRMDSIPEHRFMPEGSERS